MFPYSILASPLLRGLTVHLTPEFTPCPRRLYTFMGFTFQWKYGI